MNFCANCGTKKDIDAKFCPNCGQSVASQSAAPTVQNKSGSQPMQQTTVTASAETASTISGTVKKELIQLCNAYFTMYTVSFFLMKVQVEGGFKTTLSDMGDDKGVALVFMLVAVCLAVGVTYFTVRVQGINRGKPGWVLGTLLVIGAMTLLSWTNVNFSNFNWADWLVEAIGLGQLFVLFSIYKLLNAAKSAQG